MIGLNNPLFFNIFHKLQIKKYQYMKEIHIMNEKLGNCTIKSWTPESASIIHQNLEVHNWAPWLSASESSLIGRSKVFPEGQLQIELPEGQIVATVSTNRIYWDGHVDSLPNWDTVAGDPTTYEKTYQPEGNALVLMSMNVHSSYQKFGLATALVHQVQKLGKELGIENIIGSFRPNEFGLFKIKHGPTDFDAYIHMVQKDGSPIDAWIRSLTRNGMKPLKTDVQAMTVFGITPEEFEELQTNYHADMWKQFGEKWECGEVGQWTVDPETGLATYQESNLWGIIPNLPDYVTLE